MHTKHARKCKKRSRPQFCSGRNEEKKGYGAPVQSADRHTRTKIFLHLSGTGGVKTGVRKRAPRNLTQKRGGGKGIYVMRSVVCSRKCSLSDLRVVVQLFSKATRQGYPMREHMAMVHLFF